MNPFVFGSVVTGSNFTNRKDLIEELKNDFLSSQNVLLYGNRRIGKTSVVEQSLRSIKEKVFIARIDLLGINSVQEFCSRYLNSVLSLEKYNYLTKIVKTLTSIRPTITINNDGTPNISFTLEDDNKELSLHEILQLPKKLIKNKKVIIIIDEFQDINKIKDMHNIQEIIRSVIQHHQNISYVFLGSKKHVLLDMFQKKSNPFYNSAKMILIDKIDINPYYSFLTNKFKSGKRKIDKFNVEMIYSMVCGIPNEIQKLCHAIWEISNPGDKINDSIINKGVSKVCAYQRDFFEELYKNLFLYQSFVLKAITKSNNNNIYSKNFIKEFNLSTPGTVKKAIKVLIDKEIITIEKGRHIFELPFFKHWLLAHKY